MEKADTQVSSIAKHLPKLPGTAIKRTFIKHRVASWQIHLQRISPFLTRGEGVWWKHTDDGFRFLDGDDDPSTHDECSLLHFRHHTIRHVLTRREECWNKIIEDRVPLPANTIKLYDPNGHLVGRLLYQGNGVVYQPSDPTLQHGDSFTDPEQPTQHGDSFTDHEQPTVEATSNQSRVILTQGSHLPNSATRSLPDPALTPVQEKSSSKDECVHTDLLSPPRENLSTPRGERTLSVCTSTPVASNPEIHVTPKSTLAMSDACLPTHMVLTVTFLIKATLEL